MMKKILYFFMAAALLCGCEKEENGGDPICPVTGISMPASSTENPVIPGSSVTIQGKGFTSGSEIWFRNMTKSTDVQATVTGVTASAISFTAPEVYGSQSVLLKQDGNEWTLGTLVFANQSTDPEDPTDPEYLPRKISQVKVIFKYSSFPAKVSIIIKELYDLAQKKQMPLCSFAGFGYFFNTAYWEQIDPVRLNKFLSRFATRCGINEKIAISASIQKMLIQQFHSYDSRVEPTGDDCVKINLQNGTLRIDDNSCIFEPFSADDFL